MKTMKKVPHHSPSHLLDHLEDVHVPVLNKQHQDLQRCLLDFNDLVDYLSKKRPTPEEWNRVGGGVSPAVLPHHRAYGSVHGGS
ncbi:MAG: hypothetical protein HQL77_16475, partial [Magnetococcales bacterium]|nr:hypothetical protein [Magnetococcales bacterium]